MNNVFVTIYKMSDYYNIEIFKPYNDNLIHVWEGRILSDGYSYVVKELLTLNKDTYNIHFVYKTRNNCVLRLNCRKSEIVSKLNEIYNSDLNYIEYKKMEIKDKQKNVYQLVWCIKKDEKEKINYFFKSLSIKKKQIVSIDYYYNIILKNKINELVFVIGYSKLSSIYYDNIGLCESLCFEIDDYKGLLVEFNQDKFNTYLNEILFLINFIIRSHNLKTIDKVTLIIHNNLILKDIRYMVYNIDHNNVEIIDE